MFLDIRIYTREIRLIEHRELKLLFRRLWLRSERRAGGDDIQVERTLQNGGVGDGVDEVEGEEEERFLKGVEDACREKEEETYNPFQPSVNLSPER